MRKQRTMPRMLTSTKYKTQFGVRKTLYYVHIFLRTGMCYNCYHERTVAMEDMINPLLILSLLGIFSLDINGNMNSIRNPRIKHTVALDIP